ncbi:MAG TPA: M48 family metallopeptidase [Thermoanaerobaculia bacterium]|nr:M48 family metallopeptidase [Thermoanaerobaculia bacterium]
MSLRAFVLALLLVAPVAAQEATPAPPPQSPPTASASTTARTTYQLTPERREKAIAYARARYRLHFASFAWSCVVLFAIVALRLGPRFRDRAEAASQNRFWQAAVFVPLLFVTDAVLELPTSAWSQHLARFYGQSVQGWGSWLWDQAKGLLVGLVVAIPLVWLLYAILRKSPRRWWLWFWLALLPVIVFLLFVTPLVVEPLFFDFQPLAPGHPELARAIEQVTIRAGHPIATDRMFAMNASSKYNSINAYVSGLGASKRVVVWDTTIAKATIPQTLFVFGHEMGHYVLLHIPKGIAFFWGLLFVLLALAAWVFGRLFRGPERWGIRGLSDWASLPVLMLGATIAGELVNPVINGFIRMQEHQADVFGLEAIHGLVPDSPRAAAEAFQLLGDANLSDPDPGPFITLWLYDHPPLADRLRFAAAYDPWGKGEAPKYVK